VNEQLTKLRDVAEQHRSSLGFVALKAQDLIWIVGQAEQHAETVDKRFGSFLAAAESLLANETVYILAKDFVWLCDLATHVAP